MTTIRESPPARRRLGWEERSLLPGYSGVQWWMASCLTLAFTAMGTFVDIQRLGQLGVVFQTCYFLGCLLAVIVVQRKALFGPMVQPPLVLAVTVPSVVLLTGSASLGGKTVATALAVGTPLINNFPVMAITTVLTLAVGVLRILVQRPPVTFTLPPQPPEPAVRPQPPARPPRPAPADADPVTEPIPRVTDQGLRRRRPPPRPEPPRPE